MLEGDTICAIATGPAEGAIGIVRLSGPQAGPLLRSVCGGRRLSPRRLSLAQIRDPRSGALLEQALVCFMPGPRSYTGEDMGEVQAHGGQLNLGRLLELFVELGARPAAPGEFTRRAFLGGRIDLSQAEAVAEVIAARSERALRNAQALLAGGLSRRLAPLRASLLAVAGELEAEIDFAEELEAPRRGEGRLLRVEAAGNELQELLKSYRTGQRLQGVRVALVGEVNAGKSTLFNRLLGRERALVSEEPGTTRDYLVEEAQWSGYRVELLDCAGWRSDGEPGPLERAGQALSKSAVLSCALLLEVVDLAGPARGERRREGMPPVLRVGNKLDLVTPAQSAAVVEEHGLPLLVSALTGQGMDALRARIVEELFAPASEESLLVTKERQWRALHEAAEAIAAGQQALRAGVAPELSVEHLREALESLAELTGERTSEAVLDEVFARFCIGK